MEKVPGIRSVLERKAAIHGENHGGAAV